ncbi:MAG: hypothetical protein KC457_04525, partial [Myxococcales bacterium]|nr:hypothetical protein [Myxococcales bacterium]
MATSVVAGALLTMPMVAGIGGHELRAWANSGMGGEAQSQRYDIEVIPGSERTELLVTRTFFNPTLFPSQLSIDLEHLDCSAALDGLEIQDGKGKWVAATLIDAQDAEQRWEMHVWGGDDLPSDQLAVNGDTAVRLTRDSWGCSGSLDIYPIPPLQTRTVRYRIAYVPSYAEGSYAVELPAFDDFDLPASLSLRAAADPSLAITIDDAVPGPAQVLDGEKSHTLSMRIADAGRGLLRAADLDLAALGGVSDQRLVDVRFDAPAQLATLPPIRRVALVIDNSRSTDDDREFLLGLAGVYAETLGKQYPGAEVEVFLFDREVQRFYFDFVSPTWAAEDLQKYERESRNGSELGAALDAARAALAEAASHDAPVSEGEGIAAADWIVLFSDLDLRSDFELAAQKAAAAKAGVRMHVVFDDAKDINRDFVPAALDNPWTAMAMASGGMGWRINPAGISDEEVAAELIQPQRLWNPALIRERADGSVARERLDAYAMAGEVQNWSLLASTAAAPASEATDIEDAEAGNDDDDDGDAAYVDPHEPTKTVRVSFTGEVWGQPRSWTTTGSDAHGRARAAALALEEGSGLEEADRAALARYAQVVSPFTAAFAIASFEGTPASPALGGIGTLHGGCRGYSSRCGGGFGH